MLCVQVAPQDSRDTSSRSSLGGRNAGASSLEPFKPRWALREGLTLQGNFFEIPVKGRHCCPSLRSRKQGFDGAPGKQPEF